MSEDLKKTLIFFYFTTIAPLQIGHKVILLVGELIRNIFSQGKPLVFLLWIKNPNLLMPAVGFKPTTFQSHRGGVTPRLVHRLNSLGH